MNTRDNARRRFERGFISLEWALVIAAVLGVAAYTLATMRDTEKSLDDAAVVNEIRQLISAVKADHVNVGSYAGLTEAMIVNGELVPSKMRDETTAQVTAGGYDVTVGVGGGTGANVGAPDDKHFYVILGSSARKLTNTATCKRLVNAELSGLRGVQVINVAASPAIVTASDPGATTPASGAAWTVPLYGSSKLLEARTPGMVTNVCDVIVGDADGGMVAFGVR